jgi:hypothetical protein
MDSLPVNSEPTPDEAKRLSLELSTLTQRQFESLQKAPYLLMPREEREAYDRRRVRIGQIRELLSKLSLDNGSDSSLSAATESPEID